MSPAPRRDPENEPLVEDVVRAVLAVLEGRGVVPTPAPSWKTRARAGAEWVVKNTASLVVLGTFILIVAGLLLRGIDPAVVPAALVEKYGQEMDRTSVIDEHVALGNDLLNVGQVAAAEQEFSSALKLDTSSAKASLGLLKTQLQSFGRLDAAPAVYERRLLHLINAYPKDPQVAAYYGDALQAGGNLDAADAQYDQALRLDQHSAIAVSGKGVDEDLRNHPVEALRLYEQAASMSPNTQFFANNVAYQLFRLGRYADAIDTYRRLLDVDDHFLLPYYILSQAQRLQGDVAGAERTQQALLRLLADGRVVQSTENSTRWFFHTTPPGRSPPPGAPMTAVFLSTPGDKRCYALLSHALTDRVAGKPADARAGILQAKRVGAPEHLGAILRILRYEEQSLDARQPRWRARVDALDREVRLRLT